MRQEAGIHLRHAREDVLLVGIQRVPGTNDVEGTPRLALVVPSGRYTG